MDIFCAWPDSNPFHTDWRYPFRSLSAYAGKYQFFRLYNLPVLSLGIAGPLIQATYYVDSFAVINASIRQVGEFLDMPELKRPLEKVKLTDEGFRFEGVSFGYGEQEILHDITFTPVRGGKTAIVGPSGSGKSNNYETNGWILGCNHWKDFLWRSRDS